MTLVMPNELAQEIEDLLLSRPDLVKGFTATQAEGHGASVKLVEAGELVAGHVPRTVIRSVGSETDMRAVIALIKAELPRANLYFWLVPVIDMGRL
jgi:hypothetical protein